MSIHDRIFEAARRILPRGLRHWMVATQRDHRLQWPRAGTVDFGQLRRVTPVSRLFGLERGRPIDRHYIETFLSRNSHFIRGRALELTDAAYIKRFGGSNVTAIDVLHVVEGNPEATIVADLTDAPQIPPDTFDCVIFTQALQMIYDYRAALATLRRIIKPGGVLLLTTHGISKVGRRLGRDDWGEYWRFTTQSAKNIFEEIFEGWEIEIQSWGNVLSASAFLYGLAAEELTVEELDYQDPDFEVIVSVRAKRPGGVDPPGL